MNAVVNRARRIAVAVAVAAAALSTGSPTALAHDEIESSTPAQGDQLDEPISEVYIDFGQPVEGIELVLVGPDDRELPSEVVVMSDSEARLEFASLTQQGEYLVRYLAEEEGHLVIAAFSFTYGDAGGSGAGAVTWVLFALAAMLILGIGAYFSVRRSHADDAEADGDSETSSGAPTLT